MKKTVVMLAGGLSTRFHDLGDKPKCLLQIYDKPILYKLIKFFQKLDYSVVISLGHLSEEVLAYRKYAELDFVDKIENEPLGTGGAIKYASEGIESDNFVVINADTINNYSEVDNALRYHNENNLEVTQVVTKKSNQNQGTILVKKNKVLRNYEYDEYFDCAKNTSGYYSSTGIYIINKHFFDSKITEWENRHGKDREKGISLEKTIIKELTNQEKVSAYKIRSRNYDLGTVKRYRSFLNKYSYDSFSKHFSL